jgi:hypothetical protein
MTGQLREIEAACDTAMRLGLPTSELVARIRASLRLPPAQEPEDERPLNKLQHELLDLITLMPDSQTDDIVRYITELRHTRGRTMPNFAQSRETGDTEAPS